MKPDAHELARFRRKAAPRLRRNGAGPLAGRTTRDADIVSGRALKERTRCNVELWAACIAGAIPRNSYLETIEVAGFRVEETRVNDYNFISERALDANGRSQLRL